MTMTTEQANAIAEMREAGLSISRIAQKLGMSDGSVAWQCLKFAADPPKLATRVPARTAPGPVVVMRGGHQVRHFTPEDDAQLLALEAERLTISEIARRLGRKPNSIRGRLYTLARHDARREAANTEEPAHA